jgi:hypothetical protein
LPLLPPHLFPKHLMFLPLPSHSCMNEEIMYFL